MSNTLRDRLIGQMLSRILAIPVSIIILSVVIVSGPA
jgi:hypothetical protein